MDDHEQGSPFIPPGYRGDQDKEHAGEPPLPLNTATPDNRGKRAKPGSGPVVGSGAAAGGGGNAEDYDDDPVGGGNSA